MKYIEIAKELIDNCYIYAGVRNCCEDENPVVSETLRNSFDWDFESDVSTYFTTERQLDGACAVDLGRKYEDLLYNEDAEGIAALIEKAVESAKAYSANSGKLVLIAGNNATYGTDEDEIIIRESKVIHIF